MSKILVEEDAMKKLNEFIRAYLNCNVEYLVDEETYENLSLYRLDEFIETYKSWR